MIWNALIPVLFNMNNMQINGVTVWNESLYWPLVVMGVNLSICSFMIPIQIFNPYFHVHATMHKHMALLSWGIPFCLLYKISFIFLFYGCSSAKMTCLIMMSWRSSKPLTEGQETSFPNMDIFKPLHNFMACIPPYHCQTG